jgi:hypothetical protein
VIASIALLLAMGGTGFAARAMTGGGAVKPPNPNAANAGARAHGKREAAKPQSKVGKLTYVSTYFGPYGSGGQYGANSQYGGEVVCPEGEHPLGGGVRSDGRTIGTEIVNSSFPSDGTGTGTPGNVAWTAYIDIRPGGLGFRVFAICAAAKSVSGP